MRLLPLPGVFQPISDSRMLAGELRRELGPGERVVDLCTGSGFVAVTAALGGAGEVAAVDVSRRAVASARLNARLNGTRVAAVRGDLFEPLEGTFDLIVSNPPYIPAATGEIPARGRGRAWDAGRDGRALLDRICAEAPARLRPGGRVLLIHSEVCDERRTLDQLRAGGLDASVVRRHVGPRGPLLRERSELLASRGLLDEERDAEEIVIVRGVRPTA
jgi:release factor glutamine methyltransferase